MMLFETVYVAFVFFILLYFLYFFYSDYKSFMQYYFKTDENRKPFVMILPTYNIKGNEKGAAPLTTPAPQEITTCFPSC